MSSTPANIEYGGESFVVVGSIGNYNLQCLHALNCQTWCFHILMSKVFRLRLRALCIAESPWPIAKHPMVQKGSRLVGKGLLSTWAERHRDDQ